MTKRCYALVAGGGTAGHVLPGLAISRALVARGHAVDEVVYVGSARGIEARLVPEAGFPLVLLPGRGIQRSLAPKAILANLGAVLGIVWGFLQALMLVGRRRPKVVIGLGGYASVPVGVAAVLWRVPIIVAEQNSWPGAANRLIARFAKASAVSFPGTPLPRAVVTGNPVRPEILAGDRTGGQSAAKAVLGVDDDRQLVLVVGGSLGALKLNRALIGALPAWAGRGDLAVRHVVGARDWEVVEAERPALAGALQYQALRYEDDMPGALTAADLVVCRSGSSTCFELAAAGMPAIMVPSPFVTGDHQTANARHVAAAGGAVVVPDAELDGDRLVAEVDALLADADRLVAMGKAARSLARPAAADDVAALVERYAKGGGSPSLEGGS
jgi:UDP-N-acetylglucosamine--N-acetylmuramyl-(pentapeptide) pyrophosphoryl-undecaprenol N-acetylglucosamine transferase